MIRSRIHYTDEVNKTEHYKCNKCDYTRWVKHYKVYEELDGGVLRYVGDTPVSQQQSGEMWSVAKGLMGYMDGKDHCNHDLILEAGTEQTSHSAANVDPASPFTKTKTKGDK